MHFAGKTLKRSSGDESSKGHEYSSGGVEKLRGGKGGVNMDPHRFDADSAPQSARSCFPVLTTTSTPRET